MADAATAGRRGWTQRRCGWKASTPAARPDPSAAWYAVPARYGGEAREVRSTAPAFTASKSLSPAPGPAASTTRAEGRRGCVEGAERPYRGQRHARTDERQPMERIDGRTQRKRTY